MPGKGATGQSSAQRLALEQLGHRVGDIALAAEVEDLEDVRMGEPGDRLGFALEPGQAALVPMPPEKLRITATCAVTARTGVEMEALTAVSVAALAVYDMAKALDRGMEIGPIRLIEKRGGQSGQWQNASAG